MTPRNHKQQAVLLGIVLAITAFVVGDWYGEENRPARGVIWLFYHGGSFAFLTAMAGLSAVVGLAAYCLVRWAVFRRAKVVTASIALALLASGMAGFLLGDYVMSQATSQCLERGEEIRVALDHHRSLHGHYPDSLRELRGIALPGRRLLRGSVLGYRLRPSGYDLWVADPIMVSSANQTHGFVAKK